MQAETGNATQIHFNSYLLPSLGKLIPSPKNVLSPLALSFEQQPTPEEIAATGLLDSQAELKAEYRPLLQILANPASLVDLRFASGGQLQQFSLYYQSQPSTPPAMLMNTTEGLLLEYPANTQAIVDGLLQFCSDSMYVSFDFDVALPYGQALALAALLDLHRRGIARAFADLTPPGSIFASITEIADWISSCPENPQWITALMPPQNLQPDNISENFDHLVAHGLCQKTRDGYSLTGDALDLGNRLILIDNFYSVDIARVDAADQVTFASLTGLQAGINDLLQIDFSEDEASFKSLSPIEFALQIEYFLENGGQAIPELSTPVPELDIPAEIPELSGTWGLVIPGKVGLFLLGEKTIIGRTQGCDLKLEDSRASRQHARIERREDDYWIIDLGSSNGVLINDEKISESILTPGDHIQIGDTLLEIVIDNSATTQDSTMVNIIAPVIPAQPQPRSEPVATLPATTCQQCGNPLSPDARFCAKCGTPTTIKCFHCGNILSAEARFCGRCGTNA